MSDRSPRSQAPGEDELALPPDRPDQPPQDQPTGDVPDEASEDLTLFEQLEDEDGAERLRYVLGKDAKLRLDKHLQNRLRHISRHQIQKLIALGGVMVNGRPPKPSTKLKQGDIIDVILPPRPAKELKPEPIPLEVLYEDEDFIVINKHAGIIVHPARGELTGTLLNALAYHFAQGQPDAEISHADGTIEGLSTVGADDTRPGVVHRLDRNTTGVIIVAKRDEAHWLLARQFEHRTNLKAYLAVVHGCPDPPGGVIEQPIGKHPTVREAMAVRHDPSARDAVTLYRVRERYKGYSLVELELKTGRTHQIRVHLTYLGHPIVGDLIYGGELVGQRELDEPPIAAGSRPNLTYARDKDDSARLEEQASQRDDMLMTTPALHAALLQIRHPMRHQEMTFTAPIPSPMRDLVLELRKRPAKGPVVTEGYWVEMAQAMPELPPG